MSAQMAAASESPRMISLGFDPGHWPAGTHMCMIFNDDAERRSVIAKFLQSGLDAHEVVSYFVDTLTPEELKKSLGEEGVAFPDELDGGQFRVLPAEAAYCPDGTFNVESMLGKRQENYQRIIRQGYVGARVTGEMSWVRKGLPGSAALIEYEARLNTAEVRAVPTTGLCQYDARIFDGATLYDILSVHPMMIVHGQVLRNPYYVTPEVFLAKKAASSRA
jgi:MEDS: MEthanogen/methylotroph, DcmR Sensory domain